MIYLVIILKYNNKTNNNSKCNKAQAKLDKEKLYNKDNQKLEISPLRLIIPNSSKKCKIVVLLRVELEELLEYNKNPLNNNYNNNRIVML